MTTLETCTFCFSKSTKFFIHIATRKVIKYCDGCHYPSRTSDKFYMKISKDKLILL